MKSVFRPSSFNSPLLHHNNNNNNNNPSLTNNLQPLNPSQCLHTGTPSANASSSPSQLSLRRPFRTNPVVSSSSLEATQVSCRAPSQLIAIAQRHLPPPAILTTSPGVGKELCNILYQHNGTVYLAGRSQGKADTAIEEIKKNHPSSDGRLEFLHVDLADLTTIKKSAEDFMKREQRLDVLTNSTFLSSQPCISFHHSKKRHSTTLPPKPRS